MSKDLDCGCVVVLEGRTGLSSADRPVVATGGKPSKRAVIAAVGTTILLWASAFVAIRAGLRGYKPAQLAALRYLVASVVLGIRALFKGVRIPDRRDWPRLAVAGSLGFAIYATLLNYGETRVSAGLASFIVYTVPLFTAILATVLLDEHLGRLGWIGLGVSLGGTALLAFATNQRLEFEPSVITLVAAAFALGLYFTLQKPLVRRYGALTITSWAVWLSTILLVPFLPWKTALAAPAAATLSAVYLGVLPTVVAYSTWAFALARMPVARAAACLYSVPAIATVIGFLLLRERPTLLGITGGLHAVAGAGLVNLRQSSRLRQRPD